MAREEDGNGVGILLGLVISLGFWGIGLWWLVSW